MNKKTKVKIIWYLSFFVVFLIIWTILHYTFENLENAFKGLISAVISGLLSPRLTEYETQSGKQMQLKWIFFKKPISL
ncbi:hypothetical protein [Siansivirga zeaxanthinifaciens]|uniref:Uncharacterized protein n=1 Tax=Siansivirga zeaxanthinifaciens CC-SAMT-1 TaxID=1454006 RepID=A0A0C5WAN1_9FLAO|nr:hypothetical protein [Siansivirga zeaxanthinifaciens]AJR03372.1 hypothetical protein AW14_06675 [Siansivirga zeaxanthinifaciens CC-SAMT-1]